jgi:hypothetical protein
MILVFLGLISLTTLSGGWQVCIRVIPNFLARFYYVYHRIPKGKMAIRWFFARFYDVYESVRWDMGCNIMGSMRWDEIPALLRGFLISVLTGISQLIDHRHQPWRQRDITALYGRPYGCTRMPVQYTVLKLRLTVLFTIATASLLMNDFKTTWLITNSFCTNM